ncbi:MAG TPA: hypothetical protein PKK56_02905 [archaeon]|nr:hypothetical protein [archaeon]
MIEFTLSKLNMLIFVTAIAVIVLFFMNTIQANFKLKQSSELAYTIAQEVKTGIDTESYCSIKFIDLPTKIATSQSGAKLRYFLNVSYANLSNLENVQYTDKLVFSITDAGKKKIYASYDIDYNGNNGSVKLYELTEESKLKDVSSLVYNDFNSKSSVFYDPSRVNSIETRLIFIKQMSLGDDGSMKKNIYLIPCAERNNKPTCMDLICGTINTDNYGYSTGDNESLYGQGIACLDDYCKTKSQLT